MLSVRAFCVLALLALASCYSWIGRYPSKPDQQTSGEKPLVDWLGKRHWYVDIKALDVPRREGYAEDLFKGTPATPVVPQTKLRPVDRPGQLRDLTADDASGGDLVFRVGFISDVHLRQSAVKLFNDKASRTFDTVIDSFERNGYQEAFQNAVYAATISAFNELQRREEKPRLIINTGDATDAGTIEEAYDFAALTYHLRYPMLYAIGNHDDAIFGNYKDDIGYTKNAGPAFYPVGQKERFLMFFNRKPRAIVGFSDQLVPLPSHPPTAQFNNRWGALDIPRENEDGAEKDPPPNTCDLAGDACKQQSRCYGFDLHEPGSARQCETYPGYYSVIVPGSIKGTTVQLIALNTTRETKWGQDAAFDMTQLDWLGKQLDLEPPATVTIVFMHHRPGECALRDVAAKLREAAAKRPLVVLTGHTHSYTTEWQKGFWEINTGSLEEFPQWAALVEIRRAANGQTYLNARSLRPQLPLLATPPDLSALGVPKGRSLDYWDGLPIAVKRSVAAWIEKEFTKCDDIAKREPGDFGKYPDTMIESAQCGYLGALYDHAFRQLENPTAGKMAAPRPPSSLAAVAAAHEANVILDISPPR